jgi:hypothetical protein
MTSKDRLDDINAWSQSCTMYMEIRTYLESSESSDVKTDCERRIREYWTMLKGFRLVLESRGINLREAD